MEIRVYWIDEGEEKAFVGFLDGLPEIGTDFLVQSKVFPAHEIDFGETLEISTHGQIMVVRTTEGVYELHFITGFVPQYAEVIRLHKPKRTKAQAVADLKYYLGEYRRLERQRYEAEKREHRSKVMKIIKDNRTIKCTQEVNNHAGTN